MLLTAVVNTAVVVCVPHARLHTIISGGLVLFFVLCIYTEEKPERRKEKNPPTVINTAAVVVVCVPHARLHTIFSGGLGLFFVLCTYIYRGKARKKRRKKNTPTTPTAAELGPPHYGRYRALLTFLELLMWASSEATTATERYPNGRASSVSLLRVAAAL